MVAVNISALVEGTIIQASELRSRCFTILALYTHSYKDSVGSQTVQPTLGACSVIPAGDGSNRSIVTLQVESVVPTEEKYKFEAVASSNILTTHVQKMMSDTSAAATQEVARIVRQAIVEYVALAKVAAAAEAASPSGQIGESGGASAASIRQALPIEPENVHAIEILLPSSAEINAANSVSEFITAGAPSSASGPAEGIAALAVVFSKVPEIQTTPGSVSISVPQVVR